ncbi:MAG TPA: hypothetical protein O0X27_03745 [Methanocorpusculum sp.]|nr:hypothetical protein [Methanocorpusculum sp.]
MPTYKARQFDAVKIQEIVRVHPHMSYMIGMKEDWDMMHAELTDLDTPAVGNVRSSWWDTPILRIYDSNGALISEMEVWKEIEYQDTAEHHRMYEELLADWRRQKSEEQNRGAGNDTEKN